MKHAKRGMFLLAAALLTMWMSVTAFAAESSYNVWIDSVQSTGAGPRLAVPVLWDATATDGLLTITYDQSALSVTEEDVEATDNIAMYSANVTEPGTLKISWIAAEGNVQAGTLLTVNFTVEQTNADGKVSLAGESFSGNAEEETDKTVGNHTPESVNPTGGANLPGGSNPGTANPTGTPTSTPQSVGHNPKSGDSSAPASLYLALAAFCAVCVVLTAKRIRKGND